MGKKYFFKAPYYRTQYMSLLLDSEKFTVTRDERYVVATEPLTLREYYIAFRAEVPFKAYVKDRVELLVPDDLDKLAEKAKWMRRGTRRILFGWWTEYDDDYSAGEEVAVVGNFRRWGVAEMLIRGRGAVDRPHECDPLSFPEECEWGYTFLTIVHDLVHNYKMLKYRGATTAKLVAALFSNPKNNHAVKIYDADVDEVEQSLKKEWFKVSRLCGKTKANVYIKRSDDGLLIICS